ncbi:Leucine-rich_repeat domain superfamily [Hexamita inflata]|uniref:Leucine-rich repeat domain superfamily n=1 Tax=Hexamita inflata TaxID=28002 RepID=A0AA86NQ76_9EUKA|nr:Leucine-rich repeat domain superfamily [Hexamita inflata]CAI9923732.1 Leucine-rich repeat domain superfamily [Hexamita inflata]
MKQNQNLKKSRPCFKQDFSSDYNQISAKTQCYVLYLKSLDLSHNRIIFVDPITMLVNLKHVNFSHNRIPYDQLKRNPSLDTSQNNNIFTYQAPLSAEELVLYKRVKTITYISKIQFRSYDTSGNQSHINSLITALVAQLNTIVSLFMQFAGRGE